MKAVFTITLTFVILTFAGIACAVILNFMTMDEGINLLTKALSILVLLGISSALITKLTGINKSQDD